MRYFLMAVLLVCGIRSTFGQLSPPSYPIERRSNQQYRDFTDADLTPYDLSGVDFQFSKFDRARLNGIRMISTSFDDATGVALIANNSTLGGVSARRASFTQSNFHSTILTGWFSQAIFDDSDLSSLSSHQSWFDGASLARVSAGGADFRESFLYGAKFDNALLQNASFQQARISRGSFRAADLTDADFPMALLSRSDFTDARLVNADLQRADLSEAVLVRTDLRGADLSGANLLGADLSQLTVDANTRYDAYTRFPIGVDPIALGMTLLPSPTPPSDPNTAQYVGSFLVPGAPLTGIAWDHTQNHLLLFSHFTATVTVTDRVGNIQDVITLSDFTTGGRHRGGIDVAPDGTMLVSSVATGELYYYSPDGSRSEFAIHPQVEDIGDIAWDVNRQLVYVIDDANYLTRHEIVSGQGFPLPGDDPINMSESAVAIDRNRDTLLVLSFSGQNYFEDQIFEVTPENQLIRTMSMVFPTGTTPLSNGTNAAAYDHESRLLYLIQHRSDETGPAYVSVFALAAVPEPTSELLLLSTILPWLFELAGRRRAWR